MTFMVSMVSVMPTVNLAGYTMGCSRDLLTKDYAWSVTIAWRTESTEAATGWGKQKC